MGRRIDLALRCVLLSSALAGAAHAADREDCDADAAPRTLHAAADPRIDARAYWFDAATIRWPGAATEGRYVLVWSHSAQLNAARGRALQGADGRLALSLADTQAAPPAFAFVPAGAQFHLDQTARRVVRAHIAAQWWIVHEDADGRVLDATHLQVPGLLDAAFDASNAPLGLQWSNGSARLGVWAPTAQRVALCVFPSPYSPATRVEPMRIDRATGTWAVQIRPARGQHYSFLVDVAVPGVGIVRNRITDPYSLSLAPGSTRSAVVDLHDPRLAPPGWRTHARPAPVAANVDMSVYELHVRDFSVADATVPPTHRGRYLAFTDTASNGMRHLRALRDAGLGDVHLLPVFDFASVPETGCTTPTTARGAADSPALQAAIATDEARDCYNWGYDPLHFGAPEGSYASAADAETRVREFRAMVQALHAAGLRVGMDVVYNHTVASGQDPTSVLDRIVPGYYHRLDANGAVERSTCCANTATEHRMMARLMADTLVRWARDYGIDSFRFDLMGHQPRAAMERVQQALRSQVDRNIPLLGEGWNFGEIANGTRFVQAAQGRLDGTGIATFSDRARDGLRGGGCCDSGADLLRNRGWLNGLADAQPNGSKARAAALHAADLVRTGLAGTLRDYTMTFADGRTAPLAALDYVGQAAGYAAEPGEVVNYVENHDNPTLFDLNALRLPADTPPSERARVQALGIAAVALSQGIAYYHAGIDVLRSKSLDRNSFDSGDAFNRLDWTYADNGFGIGLPREADNGKDWPLLAPILRSASIRPAPTDIAWTRDVFRDWLRLRASTPLLRLRTAADVQQRLTFLGTGPAQNPAVVVGHLDGANLAGARELLYLINTAPTVQTLDLPSEARKAYVLHRVQREGRDARVREAVYDPRGRITVPGRTAAVFVIE